MPRRYRPPARRRKTKKRSPPGVLAQPLQPQEVEAVAPPVTAVSTVPPVPRDEGRHVTRDYSYIRTEVWRIAAVGGFITISLILTAVFLR